MESLVTLQSREACLVLKSKRHIKRLPICHKASANPCTELTASLQLRCWPNRRYLIVQQRRQEIGIFFSRDLAGEVLSSEMVLVAIGGFRGQFVRLLLQKLLCKGFVNFLTFGCHDTVFAPLPELTSADFRRGCIFLRKQISPMSFPLIYS